MTDDRGKPICTPVKSSLIGKRYGYEGLEKRIGYNAHEYQEQEMANRRYGTMWHLPCTDAMETRRSSPVCSPGKVLMWYSARTTRGASMAQLSSTIRTGRCITARDLQKSFRPMLLSDYLTVRSIFPTWMFLCLILADKAVSLPIWKVPSSKPSVFSTSKPTVPIRRKRHLPAGCNARRKRNVAHAEYPDHKFYKPLKLYHYATRR